MNFKSALLHHLLINGKFEVESTLHEGLESDLLKPLDRSVQTRIELWYFIDNGDYTQLADVRFKHPNSPGYTRLQATFPCNLPNTPIAYSEENLYRVLALIQERLELGWTEHQYSRKGQYYKSLIALPHKSGKITKLVYRKEPKGLFYLLMSAIFGKLYHRLNAAIQIDTKVIATDVSLSSAAQFPNL